MPQLKVENLYNTTITSVGWIPSSGDCDFTVAVAPENTNWFIIISPDNPTRREIMYYHDVVGNRIYVRWENRKSPKAHAATETVKMNDVAEIFNYFSDMVSQLFYTEKTGWLTVKVWWGYTSYNGSTVTVPDTNLTLTDNATNYIKYDYPTNVVSASTSSGGNVKVVVTTVSGAITNISYRNAKESFIDFSVTIEWALPDQSWNAWKVLITDGTNISWWVCNLPRTIGVDKTIVVDRWTGIESVKDVSTWSTIDDTDILRLQKSSGDYEDFNITQLWEKLWNSFTEDLVYESSLVAWDIVGTLPDGTFKLQASEVKTSTAIGTATLLSSCVVWPMKYFIVYLASGVVYGRIMQVNVDDSVTYWTATSIVSLATPSAKCALVDTNKVVVSYCNTTSSATTTFYSVVGTISWTGVTFGSAFSSWTIWSGGSTSWFVASVVKVRANAYAVVYDRWTFNWTYVWVNSISWTTISAWTNIATYIYWHQPSTVSMCYLSDNKIAVVEWVTTSNQYVRRIYAINPANTTVTTTYQISSTPSSIAPNGICRYSNTSFIEVNSNNATVNIYSIPPSGTALVVENLTTLGWAYVPIQISDFVYAMSTGTTIRVMQRDVLLTTISGTSAIYWAQGETYYSNGRIVSWSGGTLIPNIVNITRGFISWVATTSQKFTPKWIVATKTWGKKGTRAYITGGVLSSNTPSTEQMWFWLSDNTLMLL